MPTNHQQSKDILHPLAYDFVNRCENLGVILSTQEIEAIDFLLRQLIANNLWDKFKAIYPFIGRSEVTHSLNLRNPERHYIVWYNKDKIRHDEYGITNLLNGYGNTMIAPSWFSDDNIHISVYNGTFWNNANESAPLLGTSSQGGIMPGSWMHTITLKSLSPVFKEDNSYKIAPIFTYSCGYSINSSVRFAGVDASVFSHVEAYGLIVGVNGIKCYVNGEKFGREGSLIDNPSLPINAVNKRTVQGVSADIPNISQYPFLIFTNGRFTSTSGQALANLRFCSIGYALTDEENKTLYKIVQNFQTILRRDVPIIKLKTIEELLKDQYISANININKIFILNTKPYREYLNKENAGLSEIKTFTAQVKINKIEIFGPIRIFIGDTINTSVSIKNFTEL